MAYGRSEDCCCVQGIEHFLMDCNPFYPEYDLTEGSLELPIWNQKFIEAQLKKQKEAEEAEKTKDTTVTSEQVIHLVAQGNNLINQGYVNIVAFQLNTFSVELDSLDHKWMDADSISLIFTHEKLDKSVTVPVLELKKPVLIPNEMLIPGILSITAATLNSNGELSSLMTNSMDYRVYAPHIKPVEFKKIKDFNLYYYFVSTVKNLVNDVKDLAKKVADSITVDFLNDRCDKIQEEVTDLQKNIPSRFLYKDIRRFNRYLYEIWYDDIDYEGADSYYKENFYPATPNTTPAKGVRRNMPACTAIYKNGIHGRNYDWQYDDAVSFVIHTPNRNGRYASVGVCTLPALTNDVVEKREDIEAWKWLPFHTVDGINEHGLAVNVNVVPVGDYGLTYGTNPMAQTSVSGHMLTRWILDHYETVDEAVFDIQNNINVYMPYTENYKEEFHYMLSDKTGKCVILEFVYNVPQIIEVSGEMVSANPWMTNFYVYGTNSDPANNHIIVSTITPYGAGQERYNLIADNYSNISSLDILGNNLKSLNYTNLYTITDEDKIWYSELVGGDLTAQKAETDHEAFAEVLNYARMFYYNRVRGDGRTWQTVHTSVYDNENIKLRIWTQEEMFSSAAYGFNLYDADLDVHGEENKQCWEKGTGDNSIQHKGTSCEASGDNAVAEGFGTQAKARNSHAEGDASKTLEDAVGSHAEGIGSNAGGIASHAEGQQSTATGFCAHAEGGATTAMADYSHAEGNSTVTNNPYEHAEGHFNMSTISSPTYGHSGNTMSSIGIGNGLMNRKNAVEVMQNGDVYIIGIGGYNGANFADAKSVQEVMSEYDEYLEMFKVVDGKINTNYLSEGLL